MGCERLRIPASSIAAASICETRELLKLQNNIRYTVQESNSKKKRQIARTIYDYLARSGLNVVYGAKAEYNIDSTYIIVAKPDIVVYDHDNIVAVVNIKINNTGKGDYERIYLSIAALTLGAIDMKTRLVSITATSGTSALSAAKHITSVGFNPGRGGDWSIRVWLYRSYEPMNYLKRFINVVSGVEAPAPARSPSLCLSCPVRNSCPHRQGLS